MTEALVQRREGSWVLRSTASLTLVISTLKVKFGWFYLHEGICCIYGPFTALPLASSSRLHPPHLIPTRVTPGLRDLTQQHHGAVEEGALEEIFCILPGVHGGGPDHTSPLQPKASLRASWCPPKTSASGGAVVQLQADRHRVSPTTREASPFRGCFSLLSHCGN